MKHLKWLFVCGFCLSLGQVFAHDSAFGFSMDIPESWLILTPEMVQETGLTELTNLAGADPALVDLVRSRLEQGGVEFYFPTPVDVAFADNVNVTKQATRLPSNEEELAGFCGVSSEQLSQMFGRLIEVYACEFRLVADVAAVFLDHDGLVEGTRNHQYLVPVGEGQAFLFAATGKLESFSSLEAAFNAMMLSLYIR